MRDKFDSPGKRRQLRRQMQRLALAEVAILGDFVGEVPHLRTAGLPLPRGGTQAIHEPQGGYDDPSNATLHEQVAQPILRGVDYAISS